MKNCIFFMSLAQMFHLQAQIDVFDCGNYVDAVTQQDIDNDPTYVGSCILFDDNQQFLFNGSSNKEVVASTSIQLKSGFHAGGYNNDGRMHLRIATSNDLKVAVMNYDDLYNVKRYKKLELGIELPAVIAARVNNYLFAEGQFTDELNPFLDWKLDVEAVFHNPTEGWYQTIDGFYYRDFEEDVANDFWKEVPTEYKMRVRFAPPKNGKWYCQVHVKINGVLVQSSEWFGFNVIESGDPGFVKVHPNKKNLVRGDRMIFPVGQNFVAPYDSDGAHIVNWDIINGQNYLPTETHKATPYSAWQTYKNRITSYINQGGKYIKTGQQPNSMLIEFEKKGNYYNRLHYAWEQDRLMDLLEEHDVLTQYTLLWQEVLTKYQRYYYDWDWGNYDTLGNYEPSAMPNYCYNDNPSVKNPHEMLLDSLDIEYHKQRTRYYISRYGYSTKIYEFEILSEPFHLNATKNEKPFESGPQKELMRSAVFNYNSEISYFIKNTMQHKEHLVGINTYYPDWNSSMNLGEFYYPEIDLSILLPTIDVVGFNPYFKNPEDQIVVKNNGNYLEVENNESSFYKRTKYFQYQSEKPIIYSEAGGGTINLGCDNYKDDLVALMTYGFTGCAGFNLWNGFNNGEEFLWPATIRANNHMNGNDVIETLSSGNGSWQQGRQREQVKLGEGYKKENQFYVSHDQSRAVGYVRNRTYNQHTNGCLNFPVLIEYDTKNDITWNEGGPGRELKIDGLKSNKHYKVDWYSFKEGIYLGTDCMKTNLNGRFTLKHPLLITTFAERPIVWYVIKEEDCKKSMIIDSLPPEDLGKGEIIEFQNLLKIDALEKELPFFFPNPSNERITVHSFEEDVLVIQNMAGKNMETIILPIGETKISISNYAKGIYHLYFQNQSTHLKLFKL